MDAVATTQDCLSFSLRQEKAGKAAITNTKAAGTSFFGEFLIAREGQGGPSSHLSKLRRIERSGFFTASEEMRKQRQGKRKANSNGKNKTKPKTKTVPPKPQRKSEDKQKPATILFLKVSSVKLCHGAAFEKIFCCNQQHAWTSYLPLIPSNSFRLYCFAHF